MRFAYLEHHQLAVQRSQIFLSRIAFLCFCCSRVPTPQNLWVKEFLPDHPTFGQAVVIEARSFWSVLEALQAEGFLAVLR